MTKHVISVFCCCLFIAITGCNTPLKKEKDTPVSRKNSHTFEMDSVNFLLDGKPFQMISGEIHYARVPKKYWRHRIQMAKAMGCNTIASYVFWNFHEEKEGKFDFETGNHNLAEFINIVQDEGMWFYLRPGPYACSEWDFGGLPSYLLSIPDIKIRCSDLRYMKAVERYIKNMSQQIKPYLISNGGPIIMLQIENEYGSYGNDRKYILRLKDLWLKNGIDIAFSTCDGPTSYMLEAGSMRGAAVGLDSGTDQDDFDLAKKMNPGVPVYSGETYPGWITHWKESWSNPDTAQLYKEVRFLMQNKLSFNFYVIHGGTNFGYKAGANSGGSGYQPDVTSYDFGAPINEQGNATYKFYALQKIIAEYNTDQNDKVSQPDPIPSMEIPEIHMRSYSSVWENLSSPIQSIQPKPFEYYNHYYGFALYRTTLIGRKEGKLLINDLHDYATVFVDGKFVGTIDRANGENSIILPEPKSKNPVLEIFVEAMGRINFGKEMIDRKGITEMVTLNGMTLMNWEVYCLPMDSDYVNNLNQTEDNARPGVFFKAEFTLDEVADTYIDMSNYKKGIVWVNGHNLGRYWEVGPQHALYCPEPWLKIGKNNIIVFDLLQLEAKPIHGVKELY